ncbi:hypothetical protein LUZ60_001089 [Juncus effusus]|nr:hypothetical protein LUZ60_001089 [Juncus effusus]
MSGEEPPQPASEAPAADGGAIARAVEVADELYRVRDSFFPGDLAEKASRLQTLADSAISLLDSLPPEQRKTRQQRADFEFLKGKILDVFPDYRKESEDHLSKAVKLNPSLVDAWLCLGNCIWKKGDLVQAKSCFNSAQNKGPNKKALVQLSMLERSMSQGKEDQAALVEESIKHAKEAVMLDIKDGNSWYNLGNAYLTNFFVSGAWDYSKLQHSIKAYQNAEKDETMKSNPDLSFNYATANKYLENYERALHGFEAAASQDPSLNGNEEMRKIIDLLDKINGSIKLGNKRFASIKPSINEIKWDLSYKKALVSDLSEGINKGVAVFGKVILFIKHENISPLYYLLCDSNQSLFILSIYGLQFEAVKEGDNVTLIGPNFRMVDFSWKNKCYEFKSIRVDFAEQILVNGMQPSAQHVSRASIVSQNKA